MTILVLGIVGFTVLMGFIFLVLEALQNEKRQGKLEKEIEDARHINELQKTYVDIASRPAYDPRAIISRMRGKPPANQ